MTNQQMIAAILNSIQTQSNLVLLLQAMISTNIGNVPTSNLQSMCTVLGIDYIDPPSS